MHRNQDFHWAEAGFQQSAFLGEREFLERRDKFGAAAPQYQAALRRDEAYYKSKWRHYLIGGANFWSGGFVRVFARELIGLKTFGYSPVFTGQTLSFAGAGRGATATFGEYLSALSGVNFGRQDSAAINAAIGEFLFDDARFLRPGRAIDQHRQALAIGSETPRLAHMICASKRRPRWRIPFSI